MGSEPARAEQPRRTPAHRGKHQREWHAEHEDRDEGRRGDENHRAILQRLAADTDDRFHHHRQDRGLQPDEDGKHQRKLAVEHIDDAQDEDGDETGQHEQHAGNQAADGAMQ